MSASRRAGASFTPSPVMATTWPRRLQGLSDTQLLLGLDPRHDGAVDVEHPAELQQIGGQLRTEQQRGTRLGQTRLPSDGQGGRRMIPRHHHQGDAHPPTAIDCRAGVLAWRIFQPDQTEQLQSATLQLFDGAVLLLLSQPALRDGENPETAGAEGLDRLVRSRLLAAQRQD